MHLVSIHTWSAVDDLLVEAKGSELNGSCPLNGSAVLVTVVGGALEVDGRGLVAPPPAGAELVLPNGSLLKKSLPPPPALVEVETEDWGGERERERERE